MLSVVAWRQLYVMHFAREFPDLPCGRVFERHEWEGALRVMDPAAGSYEEPRLEEFMTEVAKLGGYLARKHDPPRAPRPSGGGMLKIEAYGEAWLAFTHTD